MDQVSLQSLLWVAAGVVTAVVIPPLVVVQAVVAVMAMLVELVLPDKAMMVELVLCGPVPAVVVKAVLVQIQDHRHLAVTAVAEQHQASADPAFTTPVVVAVVLIAVAADPEGWVAAQQPLHRKAVVVMADSMPEVLMVMSIPVVVAAVDQTTWVAVTAVQAWYSSDIWPDTILI